jgi:hypothetical protein
MNASHREPKKTETIEVRLSSVTKSAPTEKARAERRTVSDVLRGLIADYLGGSEAKPKTSKGATAMQLAYLAAGLGAIALIGFAIVAPARAGEVVLGVSAAIEEADHQAQIFHPNDGERGRGRIVREFETSVELNVGQAQVLCLPRGGSGELRVAADLHAPCVFDAASGYALLLRVEAVRDEIAYVTMRPIAEGTDVESTPGTAVPIHFGQNAGLLAGPMLYRAPENSSDAEVFRLTVRASGDGG